MAELNQISAQLQTSESLRSSVTRLPGQPALSIDEARNNLMPNRTTQIGSRRFTRTLIQSRSNLAAAFSQRAALNSMNRFQNTQKVNQGNRSVSNDLNRPADFRTQSRGSTGNMQRTSLMSRPDQNFSNTSSILRNRILPQNLRQNRQLYQENNPPNRILSTRTDNQTEETTPLQFSQFSRAMRQRARSATGSRNVFERANTIRQNRGVNEYRTSVMNTGNQSQQQENRPTPRIDMQI